MVTLGVHNKRLPLEDVLARKIREEFVRTVDPSLLIPNLPHNLLTDVDEEMIQAKQDTHGRTHAAWLMLRRLSRRGNWVPGLQQGLRSRQVHLEHLAQKIEDMLCEVAMEVDFVEEEENDMEVDHDSPLSPRTAGLNLDEPFLNELEGRHLSDLVDDQVQRFQKAVISAIAETFFTTVAKEPQHVTHLIELYKNIVNTISATSVTVGCLHVGLRMNYVSDVSTIRKLLEGGSLVQLLEHGLLTEERRRWLREQAAGYGLIWRRIELRVALTEDNLNHCEAFLKWVNEPSLARSVGEALLFNLLSTCPQASAKMYHVTHIPRLLRSFLDWLATHHPVLATTVATELVDRPWEKALIFAMKACREFFRLDVDYVADLTTIVSTLFVKLSQEKVVATAGVQMGVDTGREGEAMVVLDVQELSHLSLDFLPAAERLRTAGLLVPVTSSGHLGRLTFCDPFVADHAISSMVSSLPAPDDKHLSFALGVGSHHIVLHLLAKDDTSPSQPLTLPSKLVSSADTSLSHPLSSPSDTTQLLLDCLSCYDTSHPAFELVAALSPEWPPPAHIAVSTCPALTPALKRKLRHLRLDDVDWETTETTLQAVVSATRHVDLSRKLSDATDVELRAVLACTQLTNVPGPLVLRPMLLSVAWQDRSPRRLASHPALKLCNNRLQERHVCCLETAMLGLESVAHFDLSDCEVSLTHLQRLLDAMPCHSVQELVLNGIRLTDDKEGQLPKFSHLGKLRHLMLERTGLRDKHLQHLGRQLQALPDLRELSLASNVITSTGLSHLVPALASRSTLRLLRLSECELDVGSAFVIGCILAAARDLHVINLNACHLQDDGLQHLVRVLHDKLRLTKVSLWQGGYSTEGLMPLLKHLSLCHNMQFLELGECTLVDDMADLGDKLLMTLAESDVWHYLGLWKCHLGKSRYFLQGLGGLTTQLRGLDKLVLQENDLDDDSFRLLADAVRRGVFKYLRHLNLIHNPVTESGAVYLADVLHCLPRLQELLLQYSNISPQGALRLSQAALNLPDMTVLDLSESSCMTSDDARDVLREVIAAVHEGGVVAGHGVAFVAVEGDPEDFLLPQAEEAEISVPHRDVVQEDGERIAQKGEPAIITTTATEQPFTERVASPQQFTRQNAIVNIEVGEVVVDDKFHIKITRKFF